MHPVKFLRSRLSALASKFPAVTVRYAYNDLIETHIIELTPVAQYYENKSLDSEWIPVSLEFMELFPEENISFISEDSSLKIESALFGYNIIPPSYIELFKGAVFEKVNIPANHFRQVDSPATLVSDISSTYGGNYRVTTSVAKITHPGVPGSEWFPAGNTYYAMAA